MKHGLLALLPVLVRLVLGNPFLHRMARRVLHAAPFLQARVGAWMARAALAPRALAPPASAGQLSQRARQLHGQLIRARRERA